MTDQTPAEPQGMDWWWLSFADDKLPVGSQFLGVAIVQGLGMVNAVLEAHRLGVNPGGQVAGVLLPQSKVPEAHYRNRLLDRHEAESQP